MNRSSTCPSHHACHGSIPALPTDAPEQQHPCNDQGKRRDHMVCNNWGLLPRRAACCCGLGCGDWECILGSPDRSSHFPKTHSPEQEVSENDHCSTPLANGGQGGPQWNPGKHGHHTVHEKLDVGSEH
jgi:hypothetical protein